MEDTKHDDDTANPGKRQVNLILDPLKYSTASLVTAYAALRPRDGFSHPHQEHMKDTYNLTIFLD